MSRTTVGLGLGCLLVVLGVGWYAAPGRGDDAKGKQRFVYLVRNGSAKELATALGQHYKGEADIQAVTESATNCLLISAAPTVFDDVLKTLELLDRPPQLVSVEVLIADVMAGKEGAEKAIDEKELSGPASAVLAKIQDLQKRGQIAGLKRMTLTTVENQRATARVGEQKPTVTGSVVRATGVASNTITYRDVGTVVTATPRVTADGGVALELELEDARLNTPEDGVVLGTSEKGTPIRATEVVMATLRSKLSVPAGQAVLAKEVKTESKAGQAQTLVLVTARVIEPGAKPKK